MKVVTSILVILCFINNGNGQIISESNHNLNALSRFTDFDLDGELDVIRMSGDNLHIESIDINGMVLKESKDLGWVNYFNAGDIDGNGYPEILFANTQNLKYVKNNQGTLGDVFTISKEDFVSPGIMNGFCHDLDNDGDGDVILDMDNGDLFLLENVDGSFDDDNRILMYEMETVGGSFGEFCDYNQDGLMDFLFYNVYEGIHIIINEGNLNFNGSRLSTIWNPQHYKTGDINSDGYIDIVQAYRSSNSEASGSVSIHMNPYGNSEYTGFYSTEFYSPGAIAIEDIDQDMQAEILIGDRQSLSILDIENNELTKTLVWGEGYHEFPGSTPFLLYVDDLNGDDNLEIIHSSYNGIGAILLETNYVKSTLEKFSCLNDDPGFCPEEDVLFSSQTELDNYNNTCQIVEGDIIIEGGIDDLRNVSNLTLINGNVYIRNTSLTDLNDLNIKTVIGNIYIENNAALKKIDLAELVQVGGQISIIENESLDSISGFDNLNKLNSIYVENNPVLSSLHGFYSVDDFTQNSEVTKSLTQLDSIIFKNNPMLKKVNGFIHSIDYVIEFDNSPVEDLSISSLANTLKISNSSYSDLSAFRLKPSYLILDNVNNLTSLEGIDEDTYLHLTIRNCDDIGELFIPSRMVDIQLYDNDNLSFLGGLVNRTRNIKNLIIVNNPKFIDFYSFRTLERITTKIWIENNENLESIEDLTLFEAELHSNYIDTIIIKNNSQLAACNNETVCEYLSLDGFAEISNNVDKCQTLTDVLIDCELISNVSDQLQPSLQLYPNPTDRYLHIESSIKSGRIQLLTTQGKVVYDSPFQERIDLSFIPPGIYIFQLTHDKIKHSKKLVISP